MNIFSDKIGPLPLWTWVTVLAGGLYLMGKRKTGSTSPASGAVNGPVPYPTTGPTSGVFVLPGGSLGGRMSLDQATIPVVAGPAPVIAPVISGKSPGWGWSTPVSSGPVPPVSRGILRKA